MGYGRRIWGTMLGFLSSLVQDFIEDSSEAEAFRVFADS